MISKSLQALKMTMISPSLEQFLIIRSWDIDCSVFFSNFHKRFENSVKIIILLILEGAACVTVF